jgi:L-lysine 2,3-aminomutase
MLLVDPRSATDPRGTGSEPLNCRIEVRESGQGAREPEMIPATANPAQIATAEPDWRRAFRDAIDDAHELLALLGLEGLAGRLPAGDAGFPLRVPRGFVARMRRGDPQDPLLRQVLPLDEELRPVPGFGIDAVGDLASRGARGLLHKYQGRALLVATGSCAIHCRYCFRRHYPYAADSAASAGWREALDYIAADPKVTEVILSGGDPLSLSTAKLTEFGDAAARIPHLRRLRIHTRLPVVLPERVDAALLAWLAALPLQKVVVVHVNHANEIDAGVGVALRRLHAAGATLLNQAVLLRGVNDDTGALVELSERLFEHGVLPYYLHQLDRVAGAAHFEVPDAIAQSLRDELRARLPGYLVPRLVREIPGEAGKTPL